MENWNSIINIKEIKHRDINISSKKSIGPGCFTGELHQNIEWITNILHNLFQKLD